MIYLVRHGQTEFNVAGRHHGWIDSPLTQLGRAQAKSAGQALAKLVGIESVMMFVSPLGRAIETAAIISRETGLSAPATVDFDLREIGMGSAEGLTEAEIAPRWQEHQSPLSVQHMSLQAPDGETLMELGERLSRALRRIIAARTDVKVIVSHGVAGRVLQALYLGKSPEEAADFVAPHDAIFELKAGCVRRVDFGPA
jgi:probable phosphoglycerate mutase